MELFDEWTKSNKEPEINCDFLCEGIGYCKRQEMYISDCFILCIKCNCPNKKILLRKHINNIPENKITVSCKNTQL